MRDGLLYKIEEECDEDIPDYVLDELYDFAHDWGIESSEHMTKEFKM